MEQGPPGKAQGRDEALERVLEQEFGASFRAFVNLRLPQQQVEWELAWVVGLE